MHGEILKFEKLNVEFTTGQEGQLRG